MRLSSAVAICVASVALLVGCSTSSQGTTAVPGSSSTADALHGVYVLPGHARQTPRWAIRQGEEITTLKLLELQAAGRLPGPGPVNALRAQLASLKSHPGRPNIHKKKGGLRGVAIWTSLTYYSYLLGQSASGKNTNASIDTEAQSPICRAPTTVQVDHSANIWTSCSVIESSSNNSGGVREYNDKGDLLATYQQSCPVSSCEYFYGGGLGAVVSPSVVFSACELCQYQQGSRTVSGPGYEFWPNGNPSARPTLVIFPYEDPVEYANYIGLDGSGNLWIDYQTVSGYGVGYVTNPTTNPVFHAISSTTLGYAGGVYGTAQGKLTVIDSESRNVLSCTTSSCGSYLGPTPIGEPYSGGFNSDDSRMVMADCSVFGTEVHGWNDIGVVSTNRWSIVGSPADVSCLWGAAYTPSDQ